MWGANINHGALYTQACAGCSSAAVAAYLHARDRGARCGRTRSPRRSKRSSSCSCFSSLPAPPFVRRPFVPLRSAPLLLALFTATFIIITTETRTSFLSLDSWEGNCAKNSDIATEFRAIARVGPSSLFSFSICSFVTRSVRNDCAFVFKNMNADRLEYGYFWRDDCSFDTYRVVEWLSLVSMSPATHLDHALKSLGKPESSFAYALSYTRLYARCTFRRRDTVQRERSISRRVRDGNATTIMQL